MSWHSLQHRRNRIPLSRPGSGSSQAVLPDNTCIWWFFLLHLSRSPDLQERYRYNFCSLLTDSSLSGDSPLSRIPSAPHFQGHLRHWSGFLPRHTHTGNAVPLLLWPLSPFQERHIRSLSALRFHLLPISGFHWHRRYSVPQRRLHIWFFQAGSPDYRYKSSLLHSVPWSVPGSTCCHRSGGFPFPLYQ